MSIGSATLHDERCIGVDTRLCADVFDAALPVLAEHVEAEAVCFTIDNRHEVSFEFLESGRINDALEDGVLYALTELAALLRDLSQPSATVLILCGDVVTYQDHHGRVTVA